MSKHTPGPWFVQKSDYPGGLLIKPIPGQVIAQCDEGLDMKANARLIAAAPDLLDGLKAILESLRHGRSVETIHEARRIEALIEQATGETP